MSFEDNPGHMAKEVRVSRDVDRIEIRILIVVRIQIRAMAGEEVNSVPFP